MALIDKLKKLADVIRDKTGTTEEMTLDQMAEKVSSITSGEEVMKQLAEKTITEAHSTSSTSIRDYMFYGCDKLATSDFPLATKIGERSFYKCQNLKNINFPLVTSIYMDSFNSCYGLVNVKFPSLTYIAYYGFSSCQNLKSIDLPLVTRIGSNVFRYCYILTTVILRSKEVCKLDNINTFESCYHFYGTANATYNPTGAKDGYIYVPRDLIEDYKVATNWATFADQFRALEDYTVDGTTTGELDESKI